MFGYRLWVASGSGRQLLYRLWLRFFPLVWRRGWAIDGLSFFAMSPDAPIVLVFYPWCRHNDALLAPNRHVRVFYRWFLPGFASQCSRRRPLHPPVFAASGRSGGRCCFYLASSFCRLYRDVWPHCGSVRLVTAWLLGALCGIWLALGAIDFAIAATPPAMYSLSPFQYGFHTDGSVPFWVLPRRLCLGVTAPVGACTAFD